LQRRFCEIADKYATPCLCGLFSIGQTSSVTLLAAITPREWTRSGPAPTVNRAMGDPSPEAAITILVVDDNRDIREFMQAALEAAGYQVGTAPEGGQALILMRNHAVDLLITDIFMPGQEGFETIARVKGEFPRTRIVAMSAGSRHFRHDFLATATLIGVDATLRKPFSAHQLLDIVRTALRR